MFTNNFLYNLFLYFLKYYDGFFLFLSYIYFLNCLNYLYAYWVFSVFLKITMMSQVQANQRTWSSISKAIQEMIGNILYVHFMKVINENETTYILKYLVKYDKLS